MFGKSSGGYGALIHAMKYPQLLGRGREPLRRLPASTSSTRPTGRARSTSSRSTAEPPLAAGERDVSRPRRRRSATTALDDGRIARFLAARVGDERLPNGAEVHGARRTSRWRRRYDPDPRAPNGFRVPFNLETGERLPQRWRRWLRHDPVNLVARYARNLRTLRGLFIDCGWRDQYRMHYGSRLLSLRLTEHRVPHVYEEFDGTHSGVDYRMDRSLPFLYRALR